MSIRLFKTVNILAFAVLHGTLLSIFGPSLLDLAEIFHSNIEQVSYLTFTTTVATLVGCSAVNRIYSRFNAQLVFILLVLLKGFATAALPFMPSLWGAHAMSFLFGLAMGILEPGVYKWLINLYSGSRICSALLQIYHLMFALGSLLGAVLIRPFVSPSSHLQLPEGSLPATGKPPEESQIQVAYLFGALFSVLLALSTSVAFYLEPNSRDISQSEKNNNLSITSNLGRRDRQEGTEITVQIGLHCLVFVSIFSSFARYLPTYAVLLGMTKDESVVLLSNFYTLTVLSRLLAVIPASRVKPKWFLLFVDVISFLSVVYFMLGSQTKLNLTYSIILMGICTGPIYAAGTAFLVSRVPKLEHGHLSMLKFLSNSGGLIPPLAVGPIIERSPEIFPEVMFMSTTLLVVLAFYVTTIASSKAKRVDEGYQGKLQQEQQPFLAKIM